MNLYDVNMNKISDDSISQFLDIYESVYYYEAGFAAEKEIEDILLNGISGQEDVFKILAWKIGGVDKNTSNKKGSLQYKDSWSFQDRVGKYRGGEIKLKDYLKRFNGDSLYELKACADNPDKALSKLAKKAPKGLGPVYIITLFYFLTQGKKYPIYDKYAHAALKAILSDKEIHLGDEVIDNSIKREFPSKNDSDKFGKEVMKENGKYREYMKLIDEFTEKTGIPYYATETETNRRVDRALWAYGHLFREVEKKS